MDDIGPSDEEPTTERQPNEVDLLQEAPSPAAAAAAAAASKGIPHAPSNEEPNVEVSFQLEHHFRNRDVPQISTFEDHFTLQIPSSIIRYRDRSAAARVIETTDAQYVLEETVEATGVVPGGGEEEVKHKISIRRIPETSQGVQFLRLLYATVTAFWTGFLFVFCLQILLFLFLDLAIQSGQTTKQAANWGKAIGAILAFPGFVYSLACALVIAGAFIKDTWQGHLLIRNFTFKRLKVTSVEWIFFFFFLGLPLMVMGITLLVRTDKWWQYSILVWFSSVVAFYCLFAINVVFYEMKACWDVTKNKNRSENDGWIDLIQRSILSRQIHRYSGRLTCTFLSMGSIRDAEYTDSASRRNAIASTYDNHLNWIARLSRWKRLEKLGLYEEPTSDISSARSADLEHVARDKQCERIYSVDDARDVRPYVTSYTWSLEKVFCRPNNSRYIAVVRGPGALTKGQVRSSMACSLVGSFLVFFLLLAVLVYLEMGGIVTSFGVAIGVIVALPRFRSTYRLYKTQSSTLGGWDSAAADEDDSDDEAGADLPDTRESTEESQCIYIQQEVYRVTKPTPRFCWIMFCLETGLFYVYPLVALFSVGNYPLGIMFILFAGITAFRYYVNAAVVLEETGRMDLVDGNSKLELWREQSRLNEIVGNITRGRTLNAWISLLALVGFVFLALMLGAVGTEQDAQAAETPNQFAPGMNFTYPQIDDSLRYPSCQLSADLGESPLTRMAEYVGST